MIAIRGAIRVPSNDAESIQSHTRWLLEEIQERNDLEPERIVSALFTMTPDLDADFPAHAARKLGWTSVPMLGAVETAVPGAMDRMVRVLLLAEAPPPARHVYVGEAAGLRPDLAGAEAAPPPRELQRGRGEDEAPATQGDEGGEMASGPSVLILGLGLIGGSLARALRGDARFGRVAGFDADPAVLGTALEAGVLDAAGSERGSADLILLCMPVSAILEWLERVGPGLSPGTVVIDVGSTKRAIVERMDALPEGVEALAAHPLAGGERAGFEGGSAELLRGAPWATVDTARTGPRARRLANRLLEALGGRAIPIDAEEHDRVLAATSHLPWLASAAMARVARALAGGRLALSGPGLRDMTRLADSDPALVGGFVSTNRDHLRAAARAYQAELETLLVALEDPDPAALDALLAEARAARSSLTSRAAPGERST